MAFSILRLFYYPLEVANDRLLAALPATIFVLNHPNSVLDPLILMTVLRRQVTFLAKSTPFGYKFSRWFMRQFGAEPIYRVKDIGLRGGASDREDMQARNEGTFAKCQSLLRSGNAIALFPEGTSHTEPMMMPMRTGAARIACSTAASLDWNGVQIVPVGLWYENSTRFRSTVLVVPGEPVEVATYRARYEDDPWKTVQELTAAIEAGLQRVVLEAETTELLKSVPFVAAWTEPEGQKPDLATRQAWAASLLEAYKRMHAADADRVARIEHAARQYARTLHTLGVKDPWKLETPKPVLGYAARRALLLAAWMPIACAGAVMSFVPYRLSAYIVRHHYPYNRQKAGALKLIIGTLLVATVWILEAITVGILAGALWGVVTALAAPLFGYVALRWSELFRKLQEVVRAGWLRWRRESLLVHLVAERQRLAREIHDAIADISAAE